MDFVVVRISNMCSQQDAVILEVPVSLLRTLDTVPRPVARRLPKDITIHGLLAADLALDKSRKYTQWNAVVPTRDDMTSSLPLAWDSALHHYLAKPARDLLSKQQAKIAKDWAAVQVAHPSVTEPDYLYAWLLVNTRTFYFVTPKTERLCNDDRMVLQPVADLFNHADTGCAVVFDMVSFTVRADRAYDQGEEVHISYGRHSNDFLLVEYGFILDQNRWDEICLDDAILPRLTSSQKTMLEDKGFLGKYRLDSGEVCYRTEVALRILCLPVRQWRKFVDGVDDGEKDQPAVNQLLLGLLKDFRGVARKNQLEVKGLQVGNEAQREMLEKRWMQISDMLDLTINRLGS
jgi:hypothetical protein